MNDGHSRDFPLPVGEAAEQLVGVTDKSLPRGAGAEAPQSEPKPGSMPLYYTEQTFNELVAANTALMSEVAGRDALLTEKDELIFSLRERIDDFRQENERLENSWNEVNKHVKAADAAMQDLHERNGFLHEQLAVERQRTERAKGYIDRFLDEEERDAEPASLTPQPVPPAPRGPDLNAIRDPEPPFKTDQAGHPYATMARAVAFSPDYQYHAPRRY